MHVTFKLFDIIILGAMAQYMKYPSKAINHKVGLYIQYAML